MKIKERSFLDGTSLITQTTWNPEPALKRARQVRDGKPVWQVPEGQHIATVPRFLLERWMEEDGVKYDDHAALDEMLARRLNSSDYLHLRTGQGLYSSTGVRWT